MTLSSYINKFRGVNIANPRSVIISPNVLIDSIFPELVTIEDGVYLTRGVKIMAHFNPTDEIAEIIKKDSIKKPVLIKRGAFIGVNAIILPGVTIGRCSIVGAGAVVSRDVPDYAIVGDILLRLSVISDINNGDCNFVSVFAYALKIMN